MSPTIPTWRVLRSQQDMARNNARQALLVIQQRRRDQAEAELALPVSGMKAVRAQRARAGAGAGADHRTRSTRRSSHTGSGDS